MTADDREIAELRRKASAHDRVVQDRQWDLQRAVERAAEEARREVQAEVRAKSADRLVRLTAKELAAGRVPDEHLAAVLDRIDPVKFLGDNDDVDRDALGRFVATLAGETPPPKRRAPNLGQGRREVGQPGGIEIGRDRYRNRSRSRG